MGLNLEEAKKDIHEIYKNNDMSVVFEVMDIIKTYESADGKALMEYAIDSLQADSLKLCGYNFHLGTLASNLEADYQKAVNMRKYQEANIFCTEKANDPKRSAAELSKVAEAGLAKWRQNECEAQRKAMIMRQAVQSVQEMVNMLKKVVERLLYQGPSSNM